LSNAAKYTPEGGRIVIAAAREGDAVVVRVSDNGMGIPRSGLGQVFELFTQLGQSIDRSQGGLGLGLTIARRLVEMHGGTITAESAGLGQGATFEVRLPWTHVEVGAAPAPEVTAPSGLRILVVDDNADAAMLLGMLLEASGNAVRLAHAGPEALEVAAEQEPEVVLLDIGLPGLDGYEVARRIRADARLAGTMLVALTGWGSDEDRRKAKTAGFDHHLVKPVDRAQLAEILAGVRRA
jgi:CheY-like chemotaxis protein